jgi:outer membrane scaffolding protein for murein synthesis (MipA/OmpV family)
MDAALRFFGDGGVARPGLDFGPRFVGEIKRGAASPPAGPRNLRGGSLFRKVKPERIAMRLKVIFACLAFSLAAAATAARAEGWTVSVGAKASVSPPYEGADHFVTRPAATLSIAPAGRPYRFNPPDVGSTFALVDTRYVVFGPVVQFLYGRGDRGQLAGLDRVHWAAEPGAFLDLWPARWLRLHGELRRGIIGHAGLVSDLGVDLVHMGSRWDFSVGPRMGFGDHDYFERYFGVTPQEAQRSPLIDQAYDPGGGRRYTGVEAAAAYHLTPRLFVNADIGYHGLAARAADSPIVQVAGSKRQYTASVGISWRFGGKS